MPDWVQHAMWWHVYPLGFVGAEQEALPDDAPPVHRLGHLTAWLDHVVETRPVRRRARPGLRVRRRTATTRSTTCASTRGWAPRRTSTPSSPRRTTRGLRVTLDGVFNHVGRGFGPFQQVLRTGPGGPTGSWFRLTWPDGAGPGTEPGYADFEGHHALVALDHDEPDVAAYVADVMTHWLDRGVDGWRLDAAYAVPPAFWARVLPAVRAAHPDAYVFGEVLHGDYAAVVRESGMDAVTQYELWKSIWSSLNDGNFFELTWTLGRHDALLDAFVPADVRRQPRRHPDREPADRPRATSTTRSCCSSRSAARRPSTRATSWA